MRFGGAAGVPGGSAGADKAGSDDVSCIGKTRSGGLMWLMLLNTFNNSSLSSNSFRNEVPLVEPHSANPFSLVLSFEGSFPESVDMLWLVVL